MRSVERSFEGNEGFRVYAHVLVSQTCTATVANTSITRGPLDEKVGQAGLAMSGGHLCLRPGRPAELLRVA